MLTQVYEISTIEEAAAISAIGVDHVGVLVGDGRFPRTRKKHRKDQFVNRRRAKATCSRSTHRVAAVQPVIVAAAAKRRR